MKPIEHSIDFFDRLFLRWKGNYLSAVTSLVQVSALPVLLPGFLYLAWNASFSVWQARILSMIAAIALLLAIGLLTGYVAFATHTVRRALTSAAGQEMFPQAWQELMALPSRLPLVAFLSLFSLLIFPLLLGGYWLVHLSLAQAFHLMLAVLLTTIAWTVWSTLLWEQAFLPVASALTRQKTMPVMSFGSRWHSRLQMVMSALVLMSALALIGSGYQQLSQEMIGAHRLNLYLFRMLVLSLILFSLIPIFGTWLNKLLGRPLDEMYEILTDETLTGDVAWSRLGSGEVMGVMLAVQRLLARLGLSRQRLEQSLCQQQVEIERHQAHLRAVSQVGHQALLPQSREAFLKKVVEIIAEHCGYSHVGLFLLEEEGLTLKLYATATEEDHPSLPLGQMVSVDRRSAVGAAAYLGRVYLDNEIEAVAAQMSPVLLPSTRAELAIPIRVRERTIGVLDLQSDQVREFSEEDVEAMEAITTHVALALQNRQLESERQAALHQATSLTAQSVRQAWESWARQYRRGYRYTSAGLSPVQTGEDSSSEADNCLDIPIVLRGQKIGLISLRRKEATPWTETERALAREIVEQVALALENARLLADARQRATQERMIGELTSRFSRSLGPEALLQAAVSELQHLPNVREASVFIQMPEVISRPDDAS